VKNVNNITVSDILTSKSTSVSAYYKQSTRIVDDNSSSAVKLQAVVAV